MKDEHLKQQIDAVHEELEKASKLTPKERDVFGTLMTDIVTTASSEDQDSGKDETLHQRIDNYITEVEERHPQFAGALRQIMDSLNRIGI